MGKNQRDIVISAVLSIGLIFAAFFWVQMRERPRALDVRVSSVTTNLADHQQRIISSAIEQLSTRVKALAHSDIIVNGLTDKELGPYENLIGQAFPEAKQGKLIRIGTQGIADIHTELNRLRNNIEIDMLRKTIDSGEIVIEAYQDGKSWLISFTQLASPEGALFITFPATHFSGTLRNTAGNDVHDELVQTYKSRSEIVIPAAEHSYPQYVTTRSLPVPGWTLQVYPTEMLVQSLRADDTMLWLVCLICVALIAGSHAIAFIRTIETARATQPATPKAAPASPPSLEEQVARKLAAQKMQPPSQERFDPLFGDGPPLPEISERNANANSHSSSDSPPPAECFRAYDIRGIADTQLSDQNCYAIARAIASEAIARGQRKILLGRDGRLSSPRIRKAVVDGLLQSGVDVIDLGLVATPMLQFASHELNIGNTLMITGSHNPGQYNGMKINIDFKSLGEDDIQALLRRIEAGEFESGNGELSSESIEQRYIDRICSDVVVAQTLKVVIDAGNGATSNIVVPLFEELGCEVIPINCKVDGNFPSHPPDPTIEENLVELCDAVKEYEADIGIAFDGDGDRVAVVSGSGACPRADQLLMILADDMVSRNPGCEILFDIKCTRLLPELILTRGGRPTMWKCGHSFMKRKMQDTGAHLGGEYSGHIFFHERWYGFDDGMYTAARLLETLSLAGSSVDAELASYPTLISTPEIIIPVGEERKFAIVEAFAEQQHFEQTNIIDIDGIRIETPTGWGLIRASNTGPSLSLRFEAETEAALESLRSGFREILQGIDPALADSL
jgi:phosphomannomutase / phosphoglucomutase